MLKEKIPSKQINVLQEKGYEPEDLKNLNQNEFDFIYNFEKDNEIAFIYPSDNKK